MIDKFFRCLISAPARPPDPEVGRGEAPLLPELRPFYPRAFNGLLRTLSRQRRGVPRSAQPRPAAGPRRALSDINADIIGCYRAVRDSVDEVIAALRALERRLPVGGAAHFYDVRDRRSTRRGGIMRRGDPAAAYTPALAAMLIFLNRTGYNGLFRVNARGEFNVPAGRYANPKICDEANLRAGAPRSAARRDAARRSVRRGAGGRGRHDFVYLDPPYAPLSGTARFTSYTAGGSTRSAGTLQRP
jgi:DNA adenine methylase Dam